MEKKYGISNESDDDLGVHVVERNPTPDPAQPSFSTSKEYSNAQSLVKWVVGFLLILQAKYHIPNAAIDLLIKFMFALFCVLGRFSPLIHLWYANLFCKVYTVFLHCISYTSTSLTPCKATLLKSVEYRSGKKFLYPLKKNCELWRSRPISNVLSDVYDGKIWKEFKW